MFHVFPPSPPPRHPHPILENGQCFTVDSEHLTALKRIPAEGHLIDGLALGLPDSPILTDRARLAKDGILGLGREHRQDDGEDPCRSGNIEQGFVTDDDQILADLTRG